jgi:hypothetical protein
MKVPNNKIGNGLKSYLGNAKTENLYKVMSTIDWLGRGVGWIPLISIPIGLIRVTSNIFFLVVSPLTAKLIYVEDYIIPYIDSEADNNKEKIISDHKQTKLEKQLSDYRWNCIKDIATGFGELTNLKAVLGIFIIVGSCLGCVYFTGALLVETPIRESNREPYLVIRKNGIVVEIIKN